MWAAQVGVEGLGRVPGYIFFLLVRVTNIRTKRRHTRKNRETQGTALGIGGKREKTKGPPEGKIITCPRPLELSIADNGGRQAANQWGIARVSCEVIYFSWRGFLVFYKEKEKQRK